jgi:hypothetical protein
MIKLSLILFAIKFTYSQKHKSWVNIITTRQLKDATNDSTQVNTNDNLNRSDNPLYIENCQLANCTCCLRDDKSVRCGLPIICTVLDQYQASRRHNTGFIILAFGLGLLLLILLIYSFIKFVSLNEKPTSHKKNHKLYCVFVVVSTTITSCLILVIMSISCFVKFIVFRVKSCVCCGMERIKARSGNKIKPVIIVNPVRHVNNHQETHVEILSKDIRDGYNINNGNKDLGSKYIVKDSIK